MAELVQFWQNEEGGGRQAEAGLDAVSCNNFFFLPILMGNLNFMVCIEEEGTIHDDYLYIVLMFLSAAFYIRRGGKKASFSKMDESRSRKPKLLHKESGMRTKVAANHVQKSTT